MTMPCITYNKAKNPPGKKKMREKNGCPISKKNRKKTQDDTCALEARKRDEVKAVAFLSDFAQSNLFHVTTKKKKGEKGCPAGTGVGVRDRIS